MAQEWARATRPAPGSATAGQPASETSAMSWAAVERRKPAGELLGALLMADLDDRQLGDRACMADRLEERTRRLGILGEEVPDAPRHRQCARRQVVTRPAPSRVGSRYRRPLVMRRTRRRRTGEQARHADQRQADERRRIFRATSRAARCQAIRRAPHRHSRRAYRHADSARTPRRRGPEPTAVGTRRPRRAHHGRQRPPCGRRRRGRELPATGRAPPRVNPGLPSGGHPGRRPGRSRSPRRPHRGCDGTRLGDREPARGVHGRFATCGDSSIPGART